jgi:hypothetical protein
MITWKGLKFHIWVLYFSCISYRHIHPPYRAYDEDYYENEYNRFYIKKIIKLYKEIKLKKWCASGLNQ